MWRVLRRWQLRFLRRAHHLVDRYGAFPGAPPIARATLNSAVAVERTVIEANPSAGGPVGRQFPRSRLLDGEMHLILGPPGSGKTHALWRTADRLLHRGR